MKAPFVRSLLCTVLRERGQFFSMGIQKLAKYEHSIGAYTSKEQVAQLFYGIILARLKKLCVMYWKYTWLFCNIHVLYVDFRHSAASVTGQTVAKPYRVIVVATNKNWVICYKNSRKYGILFKTRLYAIKSNKHYKLRKCICQYFVAMCCIFFDRNVCWLQITMKLFSIHLTVFFTRNEMI